MYIKSWSTFDKPSSDYWKGVIRFYVPRQKKDFNSLEKINDEWQTIYYGESKVLQYFCNVSHCLVEMDAFTEVMNHTWRRNDDFVWYKPDLPLVIGIRDCNLRF